MDRATASAEHQFTRLEAAAWARFERGLHASSSRGARVASHGNASRRSRCRGLDYAYDEGGRPHQVLFGLDLEIHPGEVVLLTGPSGCGKTTLLTLIGGLRVGRSRRARRPGPRAARLPASRAGAGPQVDRLHLPDAQPARFLDRPAERADGTRASSGAHRARRWRNAPPRCSTQVGLGRYVRRLSRPSFRRPEAAGFDRPCPRQPPELVLADEPTSALDSQTGREVVEILMRLAREEGCTILMVTHDVRIADVADRVIEMEDGRIVSR